MVRHLVVWLWIFLLDQELPLRQQWSMLLYAKTDEDLVPDNVYQMSGNRISVKTLDLNQEFSEIQNQLNKIVKDHFGISIKQ